MRKLKRNDRCRCGSGKKYKRCCIVINKHCYLDESGNTGMNHFDPEQPFFFQGCLISDSDLDASCALTIKELAQRVGFDELHGSQLGLNRLALIASDLASLIARNKIQFVFTVFEKRHFLSLMIFHLIYDQGLNPAVNIMTQAAKIPRMVLSLNFSNLVDEAHLRDFWASTQTNNVSLFVRVLEGIKFNLERSPLDVRSKELLGDALEYTIQNPDEIFKSMSFKKSVAPNLAAFGMTINAINLAFAGKKVRIEKVTHDTQQEFSKELKTHFETRSGFAHEDGPRSIITDISKVDVINAKELTLVDSHTSAGLQLVDVALWIFKRWGLGDNLSAIAPLFQAILERCSIDGVTFGNHVRTVQSYDQMLPVLTPAQLAKAKQLIAHFEKGRWTRGS